MVTRAKPLSKPYEERELSKSCLIKKLKIRHPHCFSANLFGGSSNTNGKNRELSLNSVGNYKLIGRKVTSSNSYDHQCQYMLKDRYNCARNNTDIVKYGDNPTDWKLTLIPKPNENNGECNLWDFVHELGGPVGVANTLKRFGTFQGNMNKQYSDENHLDDHSITRKAEPIIQEQPKRPFIVLIMGNSYLRQTFEALACGWSTDISDYRASIDSNACYSLACQETRGEKTFDMEDIGEFLPPPMEAEGSYQPFTSKGKFYRPGVTLPMKVFTKNVTDDLAMVEFGNRIRFYYMFRPYSHSNLTGIFDQVLDLDPVNVDMLVFNAKQDKFIADKQKNMQQIFRSTGVWQTRSIWPYDRFEWKQRRDIGKWFGADNPWITDSPDGHACMPGPVDDMANLLMFLIFSNANIRS